MEVVIADPEVIFREALRLLIEKEPEWTVVGETGDGATCLDLARKLEPDVVILEVRMPRLSGAEVACTLRDEGTPTRCLILSTETRSSMVRLGLESGVCGWVSKQSSSDDLLKGLAVVAADGTYLSADVMPTIVGALTGKDGRTGLEQLSSRERQSLQLLAEGLSSKEIAQLMAVSVRTVESYRARLMEKLGLHKSAQLVRFAVREGLVEA